MVTRVAASNVKTNYVDLELRVVMSAQPDLMCLTSVLKEHGRGSKACNALSILVRSVQNEEKVRD